MRARGIKLYGLLLLWSAWQAPGAWAQQDTLRTEGTRAAVQADTVATDSVAAGNALPAADVAAAENKAAADTTLSEVDSLKQAKMFNALKYSMQKRFRPKDELFVVGSFWDHTFVSLAGGVEKWVPRQGVEFSLGPTFYASVGKWWRPYHGVRVSLAGGTFVRCSDSEKLAAVGLDVAHLFNLNAYLGGYKRGRFLEISTVEGIGYRYSSIGGEGAHALDVHLGLNLNLHLGARMDFFVEPRVAFYGDGIDHSADVNWHGYDVGYGGMMGLTYRFLPEGSEFPGSRSGVEEETFLSVAVGQQFQLSDLVQEMGIGNSTPATAINCALFGFDPDVATGPGAGSDPERVRHKAAIVRRALEVNAAALKGDGVDILAALGGFELAIMAGIMLGAASRSLPILVDGFICSAAYAAAVRICPLVAQYAILSHASAEPGHVPALGALDSAAHRN